MSRITDFLAADRTAAWLGVELVTEQPLVLRMAIKQDHTNFYNVTHGGVVFAFADVALSLASNSEVTALAIDAHISISGRSEPGDVLTVAIEELARSRRIATYRAVVSGPAGPVANFTGTVYRPPQE